MRSSTTTAALLVCAALSVSLCGARSTRAQTTGGAGAGPGARVPPRAAAPKRPAVGSISGRVVGEGGEPLPNVAVQLRPRGTVFNPFRGTTVMTDEEGGFAARGLEAGAYAISAIFPGYVNDPEQANAAQGYRLGDFVVVRMVRGGVITGTVTDASGAPLPALGVSAVRVRDLEGRPNSVPSGFGVPGQTDDRGVYRIYGLTPGVYLVVAGAQPAGWMPYTPYEGDAPTFYPSSTRDTAAEVIVRAGQESVGIDIRYREERGRRVSGTLVLPPQASPDGGLSVTLTYAGSGLWAGGTWVNALEPARNFSLEGVADGDYDLQAQFQTREGVGGASPPQRIAVRGADVTGLRLTLAMLASVGGTLSVEAAPEALRALPDCKDRAATLIPQEALVVARPGTQPAGRGPQQREAAPDASGAFAFRNLEPGAYRFEARALDENFYTRALQLPQKAPAAGRPNAPAAGRAAGVLNVAAGQQISGLAVRLAAGAAGLSGRVVPEEAPGAPPIAFSALRLHLVPAERERAEETLHYAEVSPAPDGSFAFRNLAPGRYLLVARAAETAEFPPRPAAWDADARARLRREAEAANISFDLQPCQRVNDFALRYPHKPGK